MKENSTLAKLGDLFFRNRSYIPIPFLILCLVFMEPTPLSLSAGFVLALLGEMLRIWSVSYAGSETRTTSGVGGSYLVTQGPYSIVRNPLYIGNMMIYTGIGVMSNALFPYLQIAGLLFFLFQYYCIIHVEEFFLREKFGKVFELFTSSVNRFVPGFKPIPKEIDSQLEFNLSKGLKSEKRSIQAFLISALLIVAGYFIKGM